MGEYASPKVWPVPADMGGRFAYINRPVSGATHDQALPLGQHPLQLYSLGTPNGIKITIMFEDLLALGHAGAEYDAWLIRIGKGEQFGSGFELVRVFEFGAILLYLAERCCSRRWLNSMTPGSWISSPIVRLS